MKWFTRLLCVFMVIMLWLPCAATAELSGEEVLEMYNDAYALHLEKHKNGFYGVMGIDDIFDILDHTTQIYYPQKEKVMTGVHVCMKAEKERGSYDVPISSEAFATYATTLMNALFGYSSVISVPGENPPLAMGKQKEILAFFTQTGDLFLYKKLPDGSTIAMAPVFWVDKSVKILDDSITLLCIRSASEGKKSSAWFCSDQDVVWKVLHWMIEKLSTVTSDSITMKYVQPWLERHAPVQIASSMDDAQGGHEDIPQKGTVTITSNSAVNLRAKGSTDSEIVGKGRPGDSFPCTGVADSGWYEIVLPDGQTAYVSPKMVQYKEQ